MMAKATREPEFDLKKRLVGASILIGFGVIVLPALLGGKDPHGATEPAQTAVEEPKIFVSKITPIGGDTPRPTPSAVQDQLPDAAAPEPQAVTPVKTKSGGTEVSKAAPPPKPKPKPKAEPAITAKGEPGWVVRVGTFAKTENVERVVQRLKQAGFEPSTTKLKTDKGSVTRVWIGPYAQRVEAARMRTRVKQVTGGEGYIAVYP